MEKIPVLYILIAICIILTLFIQQNPEFGLDYTGFAATKIKTGTAITNGFNTTGCDTGYNYCRAVEHFYNTTKNITVEINVKADPSAENPIVLTKNHGI